MEVGAESGGFHGRLVEAEAGMQGSEERGGLGNARRAGVSARPAPLTYPRVFLLVYSFPEEMTIT